jgi:hypothetical protein
MIVGRDEGRLTAHGEPHVVRREIGIDLLAQRIERRQASSDSGRVTRGVSDTRATLISNEKFVSAGSVVPVIGAAERWCGVAASGMWPSPASRPEVGSSPTHPAPGM